MTLTFLQHQWKAFWRSKNTGKSIAVRIILGLLVLYLLLNLFVLSFFLDKLIVKVFPGREVVSVFNGFLLYYFLMDLLIRFQMQELPTLVVKPYLHLPIKRNQIVNYLSYTSLFSGFNLSPFVLIVPFMLKIVWPGAGRAAFFAVLVAVLGMTLFNHFFSMWLKRKVNLNAWYSLGFFCLLGLIALLDFSWHVISLSDISQQLFKAVSTTPYYAGAFVGFAILMFSFNYSFLKGNLYLDELHSNNQDVKTVSEIPLLSRFGRTGELVANEIKLILRNKRPRSAFLMSFFFMAYGLLFYRNPSFSAGYGVYIFCGMFMTGIFIINYGQFMFSWQSGHFDGILTSKIDMKEFFRSKILLFTLVATVNFLLTIPYAFLGWKILMIHFVMYVWNIGVNTLIVLYFANRNYKRIDLSKGATFNWEGVGATQWILSVPLLASPFLIYLPFSLAGYPQSALIVLVLTGVIFILTRDFWLNKLVANFQENRYRIAEGFRND